MKKEGKIIAVVGGPASGKSSLINQFKKNYKVKIFLEGEEKNLPNYIKKNINKNKNGLQTILFFHNQTIIQYLEALRLKEGGNNVILDTFWLSNLFYLDTMLSDKNEKTLIKNLIKLTNQILPLPDIILYLEADNKTIRGRLYKRGRSFEKNFIRSALKINKAHYDYFNNRKNIEELSQSKIIKINVENFDFHFFAKQINWSARN